MHQLKIAPSLRRGDDWQACNGTLSGDLEKLPQPSQKILPFIPEIGQPLVRTSPSTSD